MKKNTNSMNEDEQETDGRKILQFEVLPLQTEQLVTKDWNCVLLISYL